MNLITTKTGGCITFVPRNPSDLSQNIWLSIKSLDGCWSYVGRNYYSGEQEVSLQSDGCVYTGTAVHELCHAVGFWHEQNRPDRDDYITVNFANIDPDNAHNFDKYTADYFGTPYDYYSIMHYTEYAFSVNGQKTIIPKQAGVNLIPSYDKTYDQILTNYDIKAIRASYSCSNGPVATSTTTKAPVTTTKAPVTTTKAPVTTTKAPVTTTKAKLTATIAPVTTKPVLSKTFIFNIKNSGITSYYLYWLINYCNTLNQHQI